MSCLLHWLPKNLQELPLYQEIDELFCYIDSSLTEEYLSQFLPLFSKSIKVRSGSEVSDISVNWFNEQISWEDLGEATWEKPFLAGTIDLSNIGGTKEVVQSREDIVKEISALNGNEISETGLQSWMTFVEPYIGTRSIQTVLANMIGIDGFQFEYYERSYPFLTYGFETNGFQGWDKTKMLIKASKVFKNIESELYIIQDGNDYCSVIWDDKAWDTCSLDSPAGTLVDDVLIIYKNYTDSEMNLSDISSVVNYFAKLRAEILYVWRNIEYSWGELSWDETPDENVYTTRIKVNPTRFVQSLPAYKYDNLGPGWVDYQKWEYYMSWAGMDLDGILRKNIDRESITWDDNTWEMSIDWQGVFDYDLTTITTQRGTNNLIIPNYDETSPKSFYNAIVEYERTSTSV